MQNKSILSRIRRADSAEEIKQLLEEGRLFESATDRTRSRWKRHAAKRKKALEEGV